MEIIISIIIIEYKMTQGALHTVNLKESRLCHKKHIDTDEKMTNSDLNSKSIMLY